MAGAPHVFLSSTFYNLGQLRKDVISFLEDQLGYVALASEQSSFVVDVDADTIENCRKKIREEADILILIIGMRYGYIPSGGDQSITHLEYLEARDKGIPIITFVDAELLTLFKAWQSDRSLEFQAQLDNTKILGFLEDIRVNEARWTFPFSNADEVIATLRRQLAGLVKRSLELSVKLKVQSQILEEGPHGGDQPGPGNSEATVEKIPPNLSGEALRLLLEKPRLWENQFFLQSIVDEIAKFDELRFQFSNGLAFGWGEDVAMDEAFMWIGNRIKETERSVGYLEPIFGELLSCALREPGAPASLHELVLLSKMVANTYSDLIHFGLRMRRAHLPPEFDGLLQRLATMNKDAVETLALFGPKSLVAIADALASDESELTLSLPVRLHGMDEIHEEFRLLANTLGLDSSIYSQP